MRKLTKNDNFRNALALREKQELILAAFVDKEVYDALDMAEIDPACFSETEEGLWHFWQTLHEFVSGFQRLPNIREFRLKLDENTNSDGNYVDDQTFKDIESLLEAAEFRGAAEFIQADTARDYTFRLLSDRNWRAVQETALHRGKTPKSVQETLEEIVTKASHAESLSAEGIPSSFPDGYESEHIVMETVPYGVPFVDTFLGGGGAAGEVYCLLGPTGSCKTTLLQQLSESLALTQLSIWEENNSRTPLGMSYFVSYELPKETLRHRAIANVAQIEFHVLLNRLPLSTSDTLNERDHAMFEAQLEHGLYVPGEWERKKNAEQRLGTNWRILDFSGLEKANVGGGKFEEIKQRIDADIRYNQKRGLNTHVAGIFVDYLGLLARRHCSIHNLKEAEHLRYILASSMDNAKRLLANHFRCPVFIAQQVNTKGNMLKPGVIPDMMLAAECNMIAENCDFVFVAAKATDDKLTRINCQKQRRMKGLPPVVLQVQGQYGRVVDASQGWGYDDNGKRFLTVTELDQRKSAEASRDEKKTAKIQGMNSHTLQRMTEEE